MTQKISFLSLFAFAMASSVRAGEVELASVGTNPTLIELGCSIARALNDPTAEERCRFPFKKETLDKKLKSSDSSQNLKIVNN